MSDYCFCKGKRGFIGSSSFMGADGHGRETISICMKCGKIHVVGNRNGQPFDISFHIIMPEQLQVVGLYARQLEQFNYQERTMYHPNPTDYNNAIQLAGKWRDENPLFLDTETTGLGEEDEICEIAVVDLAGQVLIKSLVKPLKHADWTAAAELHGIYPETVAREQTFRALLPELDQVLKDRTVIVYNLNFDTKRLAASARANGFDLSGKDGFKAWWWPFEVEPGKYDRRWHCAMELYAQFFGDWNDYHQSYRWQRLGSAILQCGLEMELGVHRAHADAESCRQIFLHMAEAEPMAIAVDEDDPHGLVAEQEQADQENDNPFEW